MYWGAGGIARSDLSGSGVKENFIPNPYKNGSLFSIAIGGRYLYFGGGNGGFIGRANLNNGTVEPDFLRIPQQAPTNPLEPPTEVEVDAYSLVVSGDHIYWSSGDGNLQEPIRESIGRAGIDGDAIEPAFIRTEAPVYMVRVDAKYIYWITEHAISRANVSGGNAEPHFIPLGKISVEGFAVAEGHIYWVAGHAIARADLTGRHINPHFITGIGHVSGFAVGGGYIFWSGENERRTGQWLGRANLDGSGVRRGLLNLTDKKTSGGLAVDALGPGVRHPARHIKLKRKHRRN